MYRKEYYQKNKDKLKEHQKQYYEKNKEEILSKQKQYRENNKEQKKEYFKQYRQTEKGKKSNRIGNWKTYGVVHPDFDELYEKYINTEHCELCSVKLTEDKRTTHTTRCLDHCHETGEFRNVVCHSCNVKRG
jgi:hypothetical protein